MKLRVVLIWFCSVLSICTGAPKSILFLAGKPSHGSGEHEYHEGCHLLAKALGHSGLNLKTAIHYDSWPSSFDGIDALVIYCDGNANHMALGHESELQELSDRGVGIVGLHYAVDGEPGLLNETLLNVIGGCFEEGRSRNPEWTVKNVKIGKHAVTRGVHPFELKEEWYYNLRFNGVPILISEVPDGGSSGRFLAFVMSNSNSDHLKLDVDDEGAIRMTPQIVPQVNKRGFCFPGGHYHKTWANPQVRKLVLNAIVWAAGLEVPSEGVESETPVIAVNKTILHAIAKGDAGDVRNHILLGVDVNGTDSKGWTPLLHCSMRWCAARRDVRRC